MKDIEKKVTFWAAVIAIVASIGQGTYFFFSVAYEIKNSTYKVKELEDRINKMAEASDLHRTTLNKVISNLTHLYSDLKRKPLTSIEIVKNRDVSRTRQTASYDGDRYDFMIDSMKVEVENGKLIFTPEPNKVLKCNSISSGKIEITIK